MTKYYLLLLSILTLSLTASSQTVTDTNYIRIPTSVARQVVLDLVNGDKCKEELAATQDLLKITEHSSYMKDTLISNFATKMQLYDTQIGLYGQKEKEYSQSIKILSHENKRLKFNVKMSAFSGFIVVSLLVMGMFIK